MVGFRKLFWGLDEKHGFWGEGLQQEKSKQEVNEARAVFPALQCSAVAVPVTGDTVMVTSTVT